MAIAIGSMTEMNREFSKHAASKEHLKCYSTWKENVKQSEMGKKITSLLIVNTEAVERNRCYFSTLIDLGLVAFLVAHQPLAFRGKIDAFESEDEGGNGLFLSLSNYSVDKDQRLRKITSVTRILQWGGGLRMTSHLTVQEWIQKVLVG